MLLIGISTLCIALLPFFLVFLLVCDCIAVLKGVFEHLLLLQRPRPPQTPFRTSWQGKQTISPYTTIVDTLFQISNYPQSLEKNSMHWAPIIHIYHLSSTCLRSLASVWTGLCMLLFSDAMPAVTILWIKWGLKQANHIEECCCTLSHICNTISDNGRRGDVQSKNFQSFSSQTTNHCARRPKLG